MKTLYIAVKKGKIVYLDDRLIILKYTLFSNGMWSVKTSWVGWFVLLFFPSLLRCTFNRKPMSSHFLSMFNNEVVDLHWMFRDCRKWLRVIQWCSPFMSAPIPGCTTGLGNIVCVGNGIFKKSCKNQGLGFLWSLITPECFLWV